MSRTYHQSLFAGAPIALLYGLVTRAVFKAPAWEEYFGVLTAGFVLVAPFALGALTVFFAPRRYRTLWVYALLAPWAPCLLLAIGLTVWASEAWICVVMAAPFLFTSASLGGGLFCLIFRSTNKPGGSGGTPQMALLFVVLAPYLITPIERQFPLTDSIRTVEAQVVVDASPETVWRNITSVGQIAEHEHHWSLFHAAGLPRPHEATLAFEGVGGMRQAVWADGLRFDERVLEWQPGRRLRFTIEPDTSAVPESPLPLREIGGASFDVFEGAYTLEPLPDGRTRLTFASRHRLTTRFNTYGGLWTDLIMRDLQQYILGIVKTRAEI